MKYLLTVLKKIAQTTWNIFSSLFGVPYEKQARNLDLDKVDSIFRGPNNDKSNKKVYRANRASDA